MSGVIGQLLPVGTFYSPWFPSNGNGAEMTLEVIAINGTSTSITVRVETKNSEDSDADKSATDWPSSAVTTATDTTWLAGQKVGSGDPGLLELVRFKYIITSTDATGNVHLRMLNPSWYSN